MIQIKNIHHRYPDGTYALRGIDLNIEDGEFLLICGPNGSGKTTLLRIINGLLKPTSGSVHINSTHNSREVREIVGMVFQDPDSQIIGETVWEDVAFGPENLGLTTKEIENRVDWALRLMGLKEISEKQCYLLSGGEKRRLAIAGVIAMKPKVILFDEPFSFLDYYGIREILRHMIHLHRGGHTIVITTHDVEKVIVHVDRVVVLKDGELKSQGRPDEIVCKLLDFGIRPPCYALLGREKMSWLE